MSWLTSETRHAGFITVPGGTLAEDPNGLLLYQSIAASGRAIWRTAAPRVLYGPAPGDYFDQSQSRWLPAVASAVSPDGSLYAYSEGSYLDGRPATIHVVEVPTGEDRVVHSGGTYEVLGFASEGVYLTSLTGPGIWLQNLKGDPPRQVVHDLKSWAAIATGGAFGDDLDTSDPNPVRGMDGSGVSNRLVRAELKTGVLAAWFVWPGAAVQVNGIDSAGAVWVSVFAKTGGSFQVWVVRGPGDATQILTGSMQNPGEGPGAPSQFDRNGAWFTSSDGGFWLYSKDGGLRKVMQVAHLAGLNFELGGPCT